MMDISDLIAHLEDEKRIIQAAIKDNGEEMDRVYFLNSGKLLEVDYILKLLRSML